MADNKQKIISDIYYHKAGFGSKKVTLEDARKKDKNIKMSDIDRYFRKNAEMKRKRTRYNSFVAPRNRHTYQIDLTFFLKEDFKVKQKNYIAWTCIDVLSKYAVAIPVKSREAPDVIAGAMEAIKNGRQTRNLFL